MINLISIGLHGKIDKSTIHIRWGYQRSVKAYSLLEIVVKSNKNKMKEKLIPDTRSIHYEYHEKGLDITW